MLKNGRCGARFFRAYTMSRPDQADWRTELRGGLWWPRSSDLSVKRDGPGAQPGAILKRPAGVKDLRLWVGSDPLRWSREAPVA